MLSSTHGVLQVGLEQNSPASMAFLHLNRGYKAQANPQAYARVVVVVVVDVVVVDVVVEVVVVDVVVVEVVVEIVVDELVVVAVEVVVVVVVVEFVVEDVDVVVVVTVELGSIKIVKQEQTTVSFVKFHAEVLLEAFNSVVNLHPSFEPFVSFLQIGVSQ